MTAGRTKAVLLIIDGLGDLPIAELGGRTPLESAATPNLDALAGSGACGVVDPIETGEVPNTHTGTGVLMGVLAGQAAKLQRGPVEAAGAGRRLERGEVAVRANFATLRDSEGGPEVLDRRAGRICRDTDRLAASLSGIDLGDGNSGTLVATDQHRGVLILSGPGLDPAVSDTDPGDREVPAPLLPCRPLRPAATRTADKINRFLREARRRLEQHPVNVARRARGELPANGLLTRGAGGCCELQNLLGPLGIRGSMIAGCNTVRGLARLFGYDVVVDARFTADLQTDVAAKIAAARDALRDHEMVFLHFKAPDICAHDRQPRAKRDFLERIDRELAPLLQENLVVAVAADHTTDSNTGRHTADPVPVLIGRAPLDLAAPPVAFGEAACRRGNLGRLSSEAFLARTIEAMGY
ncbi:MAG: hypothetical protein RQ826_16850 [Xanthomonadales bacterium]|nr:hypothetical protein [Xanthomonadales bacterium]